MGAVLYLDASALVKLVAWEAETDALRAELANWPRRASSIVSGVEVRQATRRLGVPMSRAEAVLDSVASVALGQSMVVRAGQLDELRALDAIHLAAALSLGPDLGALAAYDHRLERAARAAGVPVLAPGR